MNCRILYFKFTQALFYVTYFLKEMTFGSNEQTHTHARKLKNKDEVSKAKKQRWSVEVF